MGRQAVTEATYAEPADPDPTDAPGATAPERATGDVANRPGTVRIADQPFLPGYYLG